MRSIAARSQMPVKVAGVAPMVDCRVGRFKVAPTDVGTNAEIHPRVAGQAKGTSGQSLAKPAGA